jgi:hypothetical protein
MNRRIVLIDPAETPVYATYWGAGLGTDIYLTTDLDKLNPDECK